jgi:NitT/TauT family transport system substrate-binding protein
VIEPDYLRWPGLFAEGKVDVTCVFPPLSHMVRDLGIGHTILNTTLDEPWRNFFCCLLAANREFVGRNPVATKRAMRAFVRATLRCGEDREGSARRLVEFGATDRYDYALRTLEDLPYGAWASFSPEDSLRFAALRLREVGLVTMGANEILARGADFRFLDELRREMKL